MKKSIIKNLIALTFALGALVFVAGNVYADHTVLTQVEDQLGGSEFFWPKRCMRGAGGMSALVYGCEYTPQHTTNYKCVGITWFRTGSQVVNCWK